MTTPHNLAPPHPTATLLPWYLTGTLKESERQAVDEHLASCADCRAELAHLTRLRIPMKPRSRKRRRRSYACSNR